MLNIETDKESGVAIFRPDGPLSEADFKAASNAIDAYLENNGKLHGLLIVTREFPGWDSFGSMLSHIKFVRDHHRNLSYVALVTDSNMAEVAERMSGKFSAAEIKHFPFNQYDQALRWITSVCA